MFVRSMGRTSELIMPEPLKLPSCPFFFFSFYFSNCTLFPGCRLVYVPLFVSSTFRIPLRVSVFASPPSTPAAPTVLLRFCSHLLAHPIFHIVRYNACQDHVSESVAKPDKRVVLFLYLGCGIEIKLLLTYYTCRNPLPRSRCRNMARLGNGRAVG